MGEVYEAEDEELECRVALKTIRPDLAMKSKALERFRREIHLARQVTHPNVCRIYEMGRHHGPDGDLLFLTMELLGGETLKSKIRRDGPFAFHEALPLVLDLAAALQAAHDVGVVHRDFKSGNVQLVPDDRKESGVRAVVTDFGLARDVEHLYATRTLTEAGGFLGTPAYMSPEQVEGRAATQACDIYSLGLVMYEMTTGELPFSGPSPLQTAVLRLQEDPSPPSSMRKDFDPAWEEVIMVCLARRPEDRPASAELAVTPLRGVTSAASYPVARPPVRGILAAVGGLAILIAAGVLLFTGDLTEPSATAVTRDAPIQLRRSVAVVGFKNLTSEPESDWISTALAEMVSTELAAGGSLRLVPGGEVEEMKADLNVRPERTFSARTSEAIRRRLAADLLVVGSYLHQGSRLRLDVNIQDGESAEVLHRVSETATAAELISLVEKVGTRLRADLGLTRPGSSQPGQLAAAYPASPEGSRLFSLGLERLRRYDLLEARALLEAAVEESPESPMAQAALAQVWKELGHRESARQSAARAIELATGLEPRDRSWIEGLHLELTGDLEQASALYRERLERTPDDLEAGIRLIQLLELRQSVDEGLALVDQMQSLPAPMGSDPRILYAAMGLYFDYDFNKLVNQAESLIGVARVRNATTLEAWGFYWRARGLREIGKRLRAEASFAEAIYRFEEVGYRAGLAEACGIRASLTADRGEYSQALDEFDFAMDDCRAIGHVDLLQTLANNSAVILWQLGQIKKAEERWLLARQLTEQLGHSTVPTDFNLGLVALDRGQLELARNTFRRLRAEIRGDGQDRSLAWILFGLGRAERLAGNEADARLLLVKSQDLAEQIGHQRLFSNSLRELGLLDLEIGNLKPAREQLLRSIEAQDGSGSPSINLAATRLYLAEIDLLQGEFEHGRKIARSVREAGAPEEALHLRTLAWSIEAESAAHSNSKREALDAIAEVESHLNEVEHVPLRLRAALYIDRARQHLGEETIPCQNSKLRLQEAEDLKLRFLVAEMRRSLTCLSSPNGKSVSQEQAR